MFARLCELSRGRRLSSVAVVLSVTIGLAVGQCPLGLYPFPTIYQPSTCSPQDVCACQIQRPGAACQYSQQHQKYICCAGQAQECGASTSPLISYTGQNVQCRENGNECLEGYSCTNAACVAGQCMNGQVFVNGQCLNRAAIGSPCQRTEQCLGGSTCVSCFDPGEQAE
ncbi:hypothetical protein NECAME_02554 [Necator americanus]|uniref:EB domain-containing protein n=1 Tax=Necator americanus TaxID=51031 RepID=W2TEW7_NECAM|nr:hypothetical protein NECAME_02554 [Necator americanus]ETN79731.1 hypothetical protein NECAME_02554 [Necator americanus]